MTGDPSLLTQVVMTIIALFVYILRDPSLTLLFVIMPILGVIMWMFEDAVPVALSIIKVITTAIGVVAIFAAIAALIVFIVAAIIS